MGIRTKLVDVAYKLCEKELMEKAKLESQQKFLIKIKNYLKQHQIDHTDVNEIILCGIIKYEKNEMTLFELFNYLDEKLLIQIQK